MSPFLESKPDQWWHQIDVNLSGHFRIIQAVIPGMRVLGHGRIVIISSGWGVIGHPNATAYAASKAGLIALTKGLGRELGPQGILTNAIAPSFIDTEQLQRRRRRRRHHPGRDAPGLQRADPGAPAGQPGRHRRGGGVPGRTGVERDRRADPAAQRGRDPDPSLNITDGRFACLGT